MKPRRRTGFVPGWLAAVVLALAGNGALAGEVELSAEQWGQATSAEAVIGLAPLQEVMAALEASADGRVRIRYPGGEAGQRWAQSIRDWLVSLGLASARIVLEPGSARADVAHLDVIGADTGP